MSTSWERLFDDLGYSFAEPIGEGMEGVVHRLGGGLVGKAWFHRTAADVAPLRDFYAELSAQALPFATPEIVAVHGRGREAVTVERELPGVPLKDLVGAGKVSAEAAQDAVVLVVSALRDTAAGPAARALPVMGEAAALWAGHETFGRALAALVRRRAGLVHDILAAGPPPAVAGFDALARRVVSLLEGLPAGAGRQVVHGDICLENILTDEAGRPLSVLDWGFLSTAGDNGFDVSTAAGFFDMYGPDARTLDDLLLRRLETRLGETRDRMLLYRAAYAIAGATAYSADGTDDHFAWCMGVLGRDDIMALAG